jgi:osmotically-inducible protein OsmY
VGRTLRGQILRAIAFVLACHLALPSDIAVAGSSETIRESIFKAIEETPAIKGYEIEIEARRGTVWLRGKVASEQDRNRVVDIANKTPGVAVLHNELIVQPLSNPESPELARQVQARIRPITSTANHAVTIAAQGRTITLSGFISSKLLKEKLERAARETPGVEEVVNKLTISRPSDPSITQKIKESIAQAPDIKIKDLSVEVHEGIATLRGTAQSRRSIDNALTTALMTDGVEDVRSELRSYPAAATPKAH